MRTFSYGEVVTTLAILNRVGPDGLGAFRARLRHLQSKAFPPGTNTGRGRAARYTPTNLFQMVVATQFMQIGISPERIVATVLHSWDEIAVAVAESIQEGRSSRWVIGLWPEALRDQTASQSGKHLDVTVFIRSGGDDMAYHRPFDGVDEYREVLIHLGGLCAATARALNEGIGFADFQAMIPDLNGGREYLLDDGSYDASNT